MSSTTAVSLKSGDSVAYAVTLLKKNAITQADVIGYCKSNPLPLADLEALQGLVPMGDLFAVIAAQQAMAVAAASKRPAGNPKLKVGEKGGIVFRGIPGVSVQYGLTLYASAAEWLLDNAELVRKFIADNNSKLSRKES